MAHQLTSFTPPGCTPEQAMLIAVSRGRTVARARRMGYPLTASAKMLGCPQVWCLRYEAVYLGVEKRLVVVSPDPEAMTLLQAEIAMGVRCFDGYLRPEFATADEITAELLERGALAAKEVV